MNAKELSSSAIRTSMDYGCRSWRRLLRLRHPRVQRRLRQHLFRLSHRRQLLHQRRLARWIVRSARDASNGTEGTLICHRATERAIHLASFLRGIDRRNSSRARFSRRRRESIRVNQPHHFFAARKFFDRAAEIIVGRLLTRQKRRETRQTTMEIESVERTQRSRRQRKIE